MPLSQLRPRSHDWQISLLPSESSQAIGPFLDSRGLGTVIHALVTSMLDYCNCMGEETWKL